MPTLVYGQEVLFTAYAGQPHAHETQRCVVVDVFDTSRDGYTAEVYLGDLAAYESKIEAGMFDEAVEPTWLALPAEIGLVSA